MYKYQLIFAKVVSYLTAIKILECIRKKKEESLVNVIFTQKYVSLYLLLIVAVS